MSTKIEEYKDAKKRAERLREFANSVADQKRADKYRGEVKISKLTLGYYGNSSVHNVGSEITEALEAEFTKRLREAAQWAAETAEELVVQCAQAAEEEALEVLAELKDQDND